MTDLDFTPYLIVILLPVLVWWTRGLIRDHFDRRPR